MKELNGKVALVTGASNGIGRGIAVELAKKGAMIAINYNTDEVGAEKTLNIIKENGGYGKAFKGNVSNYEDSKLLVSNVVESFGKIDILINNAGISKIGFFLDFTPEDIDNIIDVNLKGVINTTHATLPYMLDKKNGSIVNISSMWGLNGASCEAVYSATKGGIIRFTEALGKELAMSNIRVNAVAPGAINTKMNSCLSTEEKEELENEIPMGRFGEASEIGKVCAFLCSDESSYITGEVIKVDGGYL